MNKNIEIKLFETAKEFLIKRFPKEWGGVTAAITDKNRILTSIAPSTYNAGVELCIETGTILEAFKYDEKITHIITIARDDENAEIKILSPCGVCQERLSYFGKEVRCAITNKENSLEFRTLEELMPHYWGRAYDDIKF